LQAIHGINIDLSGDFSMLKTGDLLFFGSKKNGAAHVTHVAIYTGNKEYINSSGRVIVNSLDSTQINFNRYKFKSLLSARRIVSVMGDPGIVPVNIHPWY
jgi:cell wall-associated NlpC family hydrolase